MAKKNTADVGFEKQIWNAADVLRGSMDASEYKHVVLGLIFLGKKSLLRLTPQRLDLSSTKLCA